MKKIILNLLIILCSTLMGYAQDTYKIKGQVTDKDTKQAVSFASVSLKGTKTRIDTDEKGNFELVAKNGTYLLVVNFIGYFTATKEVIVNGTDIDLNMVLEESSSKLEAVLVKKTTSKTKETVLLKEQQKAAEIKQSIGAQELSRKGVSDVEEGLTKVTGISKVESRGLFVRGLEDRYNNLLINDLQVPSNSPFKKIIPLDLFPTDVVGVLSIYKTFNTNNPADFAGATINVETAEAQNSTTKLNIGFGYVTGNNGNNFLIAEDANNNNGFFGIQKDNRSIPQTFGNIGATRLTANEYKENYKNTSWNVDNVGAPINSSISFLNSNKFKLGNGDNFSYILSINTDNKYQVRKGIERTFIQGIGSYNNDLFTSVYNYQTSLSALLGLKYKAKRYNLTYNSMYLRTTENKIEDQYGILESQNNRPNRLIRTNQFEQTNYFYNQLAATYNLTENGNHSIKAAGSFVNTLYEQPDRKFLVGELNSNGQFINTYGGNTLNRQHFKINGNYYTSGLAEYNLKFGKEIDGKTNRLSLGVNSFANSLNSTYRFLSTRFVAPFQTTGDINNINDQILTDVSNGLIFEREESPADYKVKLKQNVNAGYFNLFWNFSEKLEVNGGVRVETSDREIKFRETGDAFDDPYRVKKQNKTNILPAINAKYTLNETVNLRFAASKTISRPVIMEVLPIQYVKPDNTVVRGNDNLVDTDNLNLDLKFEKFNNNKEMIAVGVFGKKINNPIETIIQANATTLLTYQNSKEATLYGAEIEFIFNLNRFFPEAKNFSLGFNTSLMSTKVNLDRSQNTLENQNSRALQGASNYLLNADLKYEFNLNKDISNTMTLVYNVKGENIFAVGTAGLDHIYEKPFHRLDWVLNTKLNKNIEFKFSVDNILNPYQEFMLGDKSTTTISENSLLVRQYKRGTGFSLSLGYNF